MSGRQIVVAPLQDSTFVAVNDGRTGLRLLVSNLGGDTLNVEIMLFIADSSYFYSSSQEINFNNFSGIYALFDIGFHFKGGVRVVNGAPVGGVKSILRQGQLSPSEDRDDGNCFPVFEIIYEPCLITFDDCVETVVIESEDCVNDPWDSNTGGGTSGGGGGTGTGTGGGSGTGTGGGTGTGTGGGTGTPPPFTNTHWYFIYFTNMPVHLFIQGGGELPPGLSIEQAEKLRQLNEVCQFNNVQLDWLANNSYIIGLFLEYLATSPNQESAVVSIKDIIDTAGQIPPPPNNDPVSVANPICADIMNFKTFVNEVNNYPAAGMFFRDSYFQFSRNGADPITVNFGYLRFEAYAGSSNGNCLNSCPTALANAINSAVMQVQQWISSLPSGTPQTEINAKAKLNMARFVRTNFEANMKNCNTTYSIDVQNASSITNHLNLPVIDLDDEIPNCQ
jgi:hypothetical protein